MFIGRRELFLLLVDNPHFENDDHISQANDSVVSFEKIHSMNGVVGCVNRNTKFCTISNSLKSILPGISNGQHHKEVR